MTVCIIQQLNKHSPCLCGPYASLLDEIHYCHDSGHSDRLFNHPSSTTEPFSPGKDRQQLELIPECVAWVTLWYVLALALYIKILDMEIRDLSILSIYPLQPCAHIRFRLWWTALKCLSSLFLSCSTGTRLLQQFSPGPVVLLKRWLQVLVFMVFVFYLMVLYLTRHEKV